MTSIKVLSKTEKKIKDCGCKKKVRISSYQKSPRSNDSKVVKK